MKRCIFCFLTMVMLLLLMGCNRDAVVSSDKLTDYFNLTEKMMGLTAEEVDSVLSMDLWKNTGDRTCFSKKSSCAECSLRLWYNAGLVYMANLNIESDNSGLIIVSDNSYRNLIEKLGASYKLNGTEVCNFNFAYYANEYDDGWANSYSEFLSAKGNFVSAMESDVEWGESDKSDIYLGRKFYKFHISIRNAKYSN